MGASLNKGTFPYSPPVSSPSHSPQPQNIQVQSLCNWWRKKLRSLLKTLRGMALSTSLLTLQTMQSTWLWHQSSGFKVEPSRKLPECPWASTLLCKAGTLLPIPRVVARIIWDNTCEAPAPSRLLFHNQPFSYPHCPVQLSLVLTGIPCFLSPDHSIAKKLSHWYFLRLSFSNLNKRDNFMLNYSRANRKERNFFLSLKLAVAETAVPWCVLLLFTGAKLLLGK